MESAIRALNVLSGVIMLAAGTYIQLTLSGLLSAPVQGLICVTILLYFFVQVDLCLRRNGEDPDQACS